jgi:predicted Zn-dependent protease with MMP-like domain
VEGLGALAGGSPVSGPQDAEHIVDEAWRLLERGRAKEARRLLEELLAGGGLEPLDEADARHLLGNVLEELGDTHGMVREWLLVRRLDAADDPPRPRLSPKHFERVAERALAELPEALRAQLGNVAILVDDRPTELLVRDGVDPRLLGLFSGVSMPNQSTLGGAPYPNVITLFQRNLEEEADDDAELAEQIRITVIHETAHYFGLSDDDLERLGLG